LETVFTANQLTDTGKQNSTGKYTTQTRIEQKNKTKSTQYPGSVTSYDTQPENERDGE